MTILTRSANFSKWKPMPTPKRFDGHNVVIAENQPPYIPLPAQCLGDKMGTVLTCWEFTEEEMEELIRTRQLWISHWTFNQPFQPLCPSTDRPVSPIDENDIVKDVFTLWGYPAEWMKNDKQIEAKIEMPKGYSEYGWYFWNKKHDGVFGPHSSRFVCEANMRKYSRDHNQAADPNDLFAKCAGHTQYINGQGLQEYVIQLVAAGFNGPGWYFWDEKGAHCYGPYSDQTRAIAKLAKYASDRR